MCPVTYTNGLSFCKFQINLFIDQKINYNHLQTFSVRYTENKLEKVFELYALVGILGISKLYSVFVQMK